MSYLCQWRKKIGLYRPHFKDKAYVKLPWLWKIGSYFVEVGLLRKIIPNVANIFTELNPLSGIWNRRTDKRKAKNTGIR